jgi:hypothetical protein
METRWVEDSRGTGHEEFRLRVVDMRDPSDMNVRTVALPSRNGYTGLSVSGSTLVTSHFEAIAGRDASRFYLDRIDVSDPSAPELQEPVNVPGVVMHYDAGQRHAVTVDLLRTRVADLTWQQCAERFATHEFLDEDWQTPEGECLGYQQIVRLVSVDGDVAYLQDSHEIDIERGLRRLEAADGSLVATLGSDGGYYGGRGGPAISIDCFGPCGFAYEAAEPEQLLVLSGFADGELRTGTLELSASADPWYGWWGASHLVAAGKRALVTTRGELAIIDLEDAEHPAIERIEPFSGYANSLEVSGDRVVLALGTQGCRVVDM